jgi:hypothetical protein
VKWWLHALDPLVLMAFLVEGGVLVAMEDLRVSEVEYVASMTNVLMEELGVALLSSE